MEKFKRKIINDPLYGFITIHDKVIFDTLEHPYMQRLRRIQQLGMASLVYPGALHTRFSHSVGAMHLTSMAIENLRQKGFVVTHKETQATLLAVLLHDVGHGPFSHALEYHIAKNVSHEEITLLILNKLNKFFDKAFETAIHIFSNTYKHKFLHRLVSGQLDMDRMDYLSRDSFYTGVSEGVVNTERILKMLTVADDELAVELKGIYPVENFIMARRLMYWQVYYHKTALAAEYMLIQILNRARYLLTNKVELQAPTPLLHFLKNEIDKDRFLCSDETFNYFIRLDDYDVYSAIKQWQYADDFVLSALCRSLTNRNLFRLTIADKPFDENFINEKKNEIAKLYNLSKTDCEYFVGSGEIRNNAYDPTSDRITIVDKQGNSFDITNFSEQLNLAVYNKTISKYFIYHPKLKLW